jgi:hypothetical protein
VFSFLLLSVIKQGILGINRNRSSSTGAFLLCCFLFRRGARARITSNGKLMLDWDTLEFHWGAQLTSFAERALQCIRAKGSVLVKNRGAANPATSLAGSDVLGVQGAFVSYRAMRTRYTKKTLLVYMPDLPVELSRDLDDADGDTEDDADDDAKIHNLEWWPVVVLSIAASAQKSLFLDRAPGDILTDGDDWQPVVRVGGSGSGASASGAVDTAPLCCYAVCVRQLANASDGIVAWPVSVRSRI